MTASRLQYWWKPLAIGVALAFTYRTTLAKLGNDWWSDENYSHGLLIPFVIGYILWVERERLADSARRPAILSGAAVIALALLLLFTGTAGAELFLQRISLLLILAGIVVYFWGFAPLRLVAVPLALFALAIPIPTIILNKIAFPLQLFASRCAVAAMRAFDFPVLRQGNVIELMPLGARETKKLEVVEACSGIRSLMTLVTLAVVFAYFTYPQRRGAPQTAAGRGLSLRNSWGFWRSAILVVSAVPIAILTNALRVSGTGVLAHYYGTQVAEGFFHSFSGWVIYVVALLLLFGIGWAVDRVAPASGATARHPQSVPAGDRHGREQRNAAPEPEAQAVESSRRQAQAPASAEPVALKGVD